MLCFRRSCITVVMDTSKSRMNRSHLRWLVVVLFLVAVGGAPATTEAGASSDSLLELAAKGGPAVGFGFGVSRSAWELITLPQATPADHGTLPELEPRSRAVSLDVKLRWPSAAEPAMGFEPYAVMGPALLLNSPQEAYSLFGIPGDPLVRLGAKVGAGFNWRLNKTTTLFGSYDMTTTTPGDSFPALGVKAPGAGAPTSYDALYGIRFRY
jgi:hypothetical protein